MHRRMGESAEARRKVVGVGHGRTGTTSLAEALEILGFDTVHFPEAIAPEEIASGAAHRQALERHDAIANGTACPYPLVDDWFAGARFILTTRQDDDAWFESSRSYAEREDRYWASFRPSDRAIKRWLRIEIYGSFQPDAERWLARHRAHEAAVRQYFAGRPGDLLELDIAAGGGWEPLCAFLGVDVPAQPFPNTNSAAELAHFDARRERILNTIAPFAAEGAVALADSGYLAAQEAVIRFPATGDLEEPPQSEAEAVEALAAAARGGARWVVLPWYNFWWLDEFPALRAVIEESLVLRDDDVIVTRCG